MSTLVIGPETYRVVDLHALAGASLPRLPIVLRLMLENVARTQAGADRAAGIAAILAWAERGTSEAEIPVQPGRVLMHDTTSTPALVDIAGMRDALAEAGIDPSKLSPTLPVDVSVDHSLAVEAYARPDAAQLNMGHELRRNAERYRFLRWASKALAGVRIHPPGTGIMHTINLEQLATVVTTEMRDGTRWALPDLMIGTDSHTPMVNGIGVLAWGVGGLEAQTVMFGMPTVLRIPDVVGVRLRGRLPEGVLSTDLALVVTQRLRAIGVAGEFVEFFGPGVSSLTAGDRSVVANMAPEYGASTGYFPVDDRTLDYLRSTGRDEGAIALVAAYMRNAGLWFEPDAVPRYTRVIEIDLGGGRHACRRPAPAPGPACLLGYASGAARGRSPHPRPDRDRRDHQLHQHLRSAVADRCRAAGPQGSRGGARGSAGYQDLARAGIARGRALPSRARGSIATSQRSDSTSSASAARPASATPGPFLRRAVKGRRR
jgi:aconitate hydratase